MTQENSQYSILNTVLARLIKTTSDSEPILGLEVIDGPYTGVVFAFTKFTVQNHKMDNGMVPAKFELTIYGAPKDFVQDEAFDEYTRDVLLAWLSYISTHSFAPLLAAEAAKGVH